MKVISSANFLAIIAWSQSCLAANNALRSRSLEGEEAKEEGGEQQQHFAFQSRIVGGSIANAKDFEFSVNIGGCGGSLIYEDIILTAAHCQPIYPDVVRIGGSTQDNGVRKAVMGTGVPHPRYNVNSQDYDFMVYKLASPVVGYNPVPLNTDSAKPSGTETLTVIGFGSTYEGGPGSFGLRKVDLSNVPHNICNRAYYGQIEEDIMFCAGVSGGGKDSCQGDSGGPIIDQNGVQVGVTSWGNGCAQNGFPGVYARVSAVYDWIQDRICELSDNPPTGCVVGSSTGTGIGNGNSNGNDNPNSDFIQPKGISLRVDINYDKYPSENAWVLYNDDTKEELKFVNYGDVTAPGLSSESVTFTDLARGKYVFVMLDNFEDGICCQYGQGSIQLYELFPPESGRTEELRWSHDGRFLNAAGAAFRVDNAQRALGQFHIEVDTRADLSQSPYLLP